MVSQIRLACDADVEAINAIYNYEILHTTATFDTAPLTVDDQRKWLARHQSPRHPVLVHLIEDAVVGWASGSQWSDRCAYARASETSVYIDRQNRGKGIGHALLSELVSRSRDAGIAVLLARMCTENAGSIALHQKLGFTMVGTMRGVGEKFGRILDVVLYELQLGSVG